MKRGTLRIAVLAILFLRNAPDAFGQESFSCTLGTQPACLDYGAVVCKSSATCVAKDAVCFEPNTCDNRGFVCKSSLIEANNELAAAQAQFALEMSYLQTAQAKERRVADCVASADTLDKAKECLGL